MTRKLVQLVVGLLLYGLSVAMYVRADLGLDPWNAFHQGLSLLTGLSLGTILVIVSFVVLLLWIPLRQKPGIGTLLNALLIGVFADVFLSWIAPIESLSLRIPLLVGAILLNAVATACYIGAHLGAGPRDGLMTGLVKRTGKSVRLIRTSIELTVLACGWLLGGSIGIGTVLYAVAIGPLVQLLLPWFEKFGVGSTTPRTPA